MSGRFEWRDGLDGPVIHLESDLGAITARVVGEGRRFKFFDDQPYGDRAMGVMYDESYRLLVELDGRTRLSSLFYDVESAKSAGTNALELLCGPGWQRFDPADEP